MGWLSGWLYRKSHVINPASGAGTNYQVKITVHYGSGTDSGPDVYLNGKCRADFGDIRFTASDGVTLLDYWMETYVASDYAIFWVEVTDDLSSNPVTIYIYYGKSDATSISNGDATFLFFDDFLGTALDPNKWTQITPGHTVANSEVWVADPNPSIDQLEGIRSTTTISGNFALEVKRNRMKFVATTGTIHSPIYLYIDANNRIYMYRYYHYSWGWRDPQIDKVVAGTTTTLYSDTSNHGESYGTEYIIHAMVAKVGQTYKFYWDYPLDAQGYVLVWSGSITDFPATQAFYIELAAWNSPDTSSFYTDVVFVRKFTDPEPAQDGWGSEESAALTFSDTVSPTIEDTYSVSVVAPLSFGDTVSPTIEDTYSVSIALPLSFGDTVSPTIEDSYSVSVLYPEIFKDAVDTLIEDSYSIIVLYPEIFRDTISPIVEDSYSIIVFIPKTFIDTIGVSIEDSYSVKTVIMPPPPGASIVIYGLWRLIERMLGMP